MLAELAGEGIELAKERLVDREKVFEIVGRPR